MATPTSTTKAKPGAAKAAPEALSVSPELETLLTIKVGRPASLWRYLNRIYAWATGQIGKDEWDAAFAVALQQVDGKAMHPEDAARKVENMLAAMLDLGDKGRANAAVAKCELSDHAILVAFIGRPSQGFYHARHLRLLDPGKRRG